MCIICYLDFPTNFNTCVISSRYQLLSVIYLKILTVYVLPIPLLMSFDKILVFNVNTVNFDSPFFLYEQTQFYVREASFRIQSNIFALSKCSLHVCMHAYVFVLISVSIMWRPEENHGCHSSGAAHLFKPGSLLEA